MKSIKSTLCMVALLALVGAPLLAEYSFKHGAALEWEYMQTKAARVRSACAGISLAAATAGIYWLCKHGWKSIKPGAEKAEPSKENKLRSIAKLSILAGLAAIGSFIFESHNNAKYLSKNDYESGRRAFAARMSEPIGFWPMGA